MRVHYLQHVPFEGLGSMAAFFRQKEFSIDATHLYRGENLPSLDVFDWLIVMGGPMGVNDHDRFPWLGAEIELIARAIDAGKRILGICLGAQLIAKALGMPVKRNAHREIGWFPITTSKSFRTSVLASALPSGLDVFHWHGDTFEIPSQAVSIGSSQACAHQGFVIDDRIVALQFHLETTLASARALIENCADELDGTAYVQSAEEMLASQQRFDRINRAMRALLQLIRQNRH